MTNNYIINLTDCGAVQVHVETDTYRGVTKLQGHQVFVAGVEVTSGYLVDWVAEQFEEHELEAFRLLDDHILAVPVLADDLDPSDFMERRSA